MKKILIYLNTTYHVETLLSIYASIININCEPYIFFPKKSDIFGLTNLCEKYNLNYIKEKDFNTATLDNFDLNIIISGSESCNHKLPEGDIDVLNLLKNYKTLLLYHVSNYLPLYTSNKSFFKNSHGLSVTQFSQKYNLNFIYQTDNIIARKLKLKKKLTEDGPIKILFLARFNLLNRNYDYIDKIIKINNFLETPIEINFVGTNKKKPVSFASQKVLSLQNTNNILFKKDFDLNECQFYDRLNNCDFILNTIDQKLIKYFDYRFTSTINHIIAFEKPNISFCFLSNIYNIPSCPFLTKNNFDKFLISIFKKLNNNNYELMCNSFDILKTNMYNHNNLILNKIINDL
jgi:hypothetical protein